MLTPLFSCILNQYDVTSKLLCDERWNVPPLKWILCAPVSDKHPLIQITLREKKSISYRVLGSATWRLMWEKDDRTFPCQKWSDAAVLNQRNACPKSTLISSNSCQRQWAHIWYEGCDDKVNLYVELQGLTLLRNWDLYKRRNEDIRKGRLNYVQHLQDSIEEVAWRHFNCQGQSILDLLGSDSPPWTALDMAHSSGVTGN